MNRGEAASVTFARVGLYSHDRPRPDHVAIGVQHYATTVRLDPKALTGLKWAVVGVFEGGQAMFQEGPQRIV